MTKYYQQIAKPIQLSWISQNPTICQSLVILHARADKARIFQWFFMFLPQAEKIKKDISKKALDSDYHKWVNR